MLEDSERVVAECKWQQPILDALNSKFPGAEIACPELTFGRGWIDVFWDGFYGHDVPERLRMVDDVIADLSSEAAKRIVVFPMTLADSREVDEP